MGIFTKIINYNYNICEEDAELEVELQIISSRYHFSPKIIETYFGEEHCNITMENLETLNLADKYGENPEDIPLDIWTQIRYILTVLYEEEGIESVFKSLDGVLKDLAEDEPKKPVLALPAP